MIFQLWFNHDQYSRNDEINGLKYISNAGGFLSELFLDIFDDSETVGVVVLFLHLFIIFHVEDLERVF